MAASEGHHCVGIHSSSNVAAGVLTNQRAGTKEGSVLYTWHACMHEQSGLVKFAITPMLLTVGN